MTVQNHGAVNFVKIFFRITLYNHCMTLQYLSLCHSSNNKIMSNYNDVIFAADSYESVKNV